MGRLCPENALTCMRGYIWRLSNTVYWSLNTVPAAPAAFTGDELNTETESVPGVFRWISVSGTERAVNSVLFKAKERKTCFCPQHKDVFTFSGTALLT